MPIHPPTHLPTHIYPPKSQALMQFGSFMRDEARERGEDALATELPFDQGAILEVRGCEGGLSFSSLLSPLSSLLSPPSCRSPHSPSPLPLIHLHARLTPASSSGSIHIHSAGTGAHDPHHPPRGFGWRRPLAPAPRRRQKEGRRGHARQPQLPIRGCQVRGQIGYGADRLWGRLVGVCVGGEAGVRAGL